jgi:hypothetical protein
MLAFRLAVHRKEKTACRKALSSQPPQTPLIRQCRSRELRPPNAFCVAGVFMHRLTHSQLEPAAASSSSTPQQHQQQQLQLQVGSF